MIRVIRRLSYAHSVLQASAADPVPAGRLVFPLMMPDDGGARVTSLLANTGEPSYARHALAIGTALEAWVCMSECPAPAMHYRGRGVHERLLCVRGVPDAMSLCGEQRLPSLWSPDGAALPRVQGCSSSSLGRVLGPAAPGCLGQGHRVLQPTGACIF